jgi:hypothetical protein
MKQQLTEVKRIQELAGIKTEAEITLPSELGIYISPKTGKYDIFYNKETNELPFYEVVKAGNLIKSFVAQLPDGEIVGGDVNVVGIDGLDIQCEFTTSLSREEVQAIKDRR